MQARGDTGAATPLATKIKVCGVTTRANALAVARAGVDWIGLNFYPPSPRYVSIDRAELIVRALPPECAAVGVFVNRPVAEIRAIAECTGISILQLSGDEPPHELAALSPLEVVKGFRVESADDVMRAQAYVEACRVAGIRLAACLFDARDPLLMGGTGRTIDSDVLRFIKAIVPALGRVILAGGLTPENVADHIRAIQPWMVDVASGVESRPGVKDAARVKAFVRAVRTH